MSRGLGAKQAAILKVLADAGRWLWARDLVAAVWDGEAEAMIPYPFYSSTLRAANSLAARGLVRSGFPDDFPPRGGEHWRMAYWLPAQVPPALRRTFGMPEVERAILTVLKASAEPLPRGHLSSNVVHALAHTRREQDRLAVPVHRALRRLLDRGEVQSVPYQCWGEMKKCYITALTNR